jgi:hypothetical protein
MAMTNAQIIAHACRIAKCPGYSVLAGQLYNTILNDLCQTYDFEIARKLFTFNLSPALGSGPYPLPADWLRGKDRSIFYVISGTPYNMINISIEEFDQQSQTAGLSGYPEAYTTDMSQTPPAMYVWQPAGGSYPMTCRYYAMMPDIVSPEASNAVPWFQNTQYLIEKLAAALMGVTADQRHPQYLMMAANTLREFLTMKDDTEGRAKQVTLDRRAFNRKTQLPSTKIQGPF